MGLFMIKKELRFFILAAIIMAFGITRSSNSVTIAEENTDTKNKDMSAELRASDQEFDTERDIDMTNLDMNKLEQANWVSKTVGTVKRYVLENGMAILVRPVHTVPSVSIQLWYNVGSKDEQDGERGIAHLIEHMIFKGTEKLSESDINTITHMLSGSTNAFTSYDFTGYLFNVPSHNWRQVFPVMADCMENCSFKEDMLSSEMKAVIQELKMYRDKYMRSLVDEKIGLLFPDHPYHHPIIGYKQDLWSVQAEDLRKFYKKHYKSNNATLVVVGDVDPDEVFEQAKKDFGHIKPDLSYIKQEFYHTKDIVAKSIEMYRDVTQPYVIFTFVVPGTKAKQDHIVSLVDLILGQGKSSRLYKKIVDELQLATSLATSSESLFDHGLFFIVAEPKTAEAIPAIQAAIKQELELLIANGITDEELTRAIKQTKMDLYALLEENESQAYEIAQYFLATGDADYMFNYLNYPYEQLKQEANALIAAYLRPCVMHKGAILPLPASEKAEWARLQKISDEGDQLILSGRVRDTEIEEPRYAHEVELGIRKEFKFPRAQEAVLSNGVKVYYYDNNNTPKIDIVINLAARPYCDSVELPGLYHFVTQMMTEGTRNYTAQELAHLIESRGIQLSVSPGRISMSLLSEDLAFGLDILKEILTNATFDPKEMEKVRQQLFARIKNFWDEPNQFSGQLVKEEIYKGHPYGKNMLGTKESIAAITQKDLQSFYQKYISLAGAKMAVVGDLSGYSVMQELEAKLSGLKGADIAPEKFPTLACSTAKTINYPINRDQVVLSFASLSVDRKDPDYDKLVLFDQIFGGGVLGSMSSRLFDLREQSGLFYTINGSLSSNASEQPGVFSVRTIVSMDRLAEAEKAIRGLINTVVDTITEDEIEEARSAVINSAVNNFTANDRMAEAFLFLDKYGFASDYFDKRAEQLEKITLKQVQDAARKVMQEKNLLMLRVGRVENPEQEDEKSKKKPKS
jgi:zinc protease